MTVYKEKHSPTCINVLQCKLFENFLQKIKNVYKKKLVGVNEIKTIIMRDDIDYLKDLDL